jgi:hypothetical protein
MSAKDIIIKPISAKDANAIVKRMHYSGKVVPNSQLHFGVFLNGRLEGAMQFGPSMRKDLIRPLVDGTGWNGFIELNRMAFSDRLPRNSESRAMSVAFRLMRKHCPHIEWVVSFADGTQCGDGTIYRAAGFVLTGIKQNSQMAINPETGKVMHKIAAYHQGSEYEHSKWEKLKGFQLRYIYFINPKAKDRLTVPILPFRKIDEMGAGMYKGEKITRVKKLDSEHPSEQGGAVPTDTLHLQAVPNPKGGNPPIDAGVNILTKPSNPARVSKRKVGI